LEGLQSFNPNGSSSPDSINRLQPIPTHTDHKGRERERERERERGGGVSALLSLQLHVKILLGVKREKKKYDPFFIFIFFKKSDSMTYLPTN
jgi:hypothetical protein